MSTLICHQEKVDERVWNQLREVCPFHALEKIDGIVTVNSGCKMCMLCIRNGPPGVMELVEDSKIGVDKSLWKGIAVYVEHTGGSIHPVTMELIGKARELAAAADFPVSCVFAGYQITEQAGELLFYGVDRVYVYDSEMLAHFRIEPYTAVLEDFINRVKPSSLLVGATPSGRSLAPRAAARFRTGLTADCTGLEMDENTDLVQIRPAFGGNIMARIKCSGTRPQIATVRYKVMNPPIRNSEPEGKIILCELDQTKFASGIRVLEVRKKALEVDLSEAEVIVAAGRAFRTDRDMAMAEELAKLLGARIAGTRPMIEAGFINAKQQIGLSGRTVKPKLIITLGISGSVQFAAGMKGAERIFAVNTDPHAPIFHFAHYGIIGNVYEVVPQLIESIRSTKAGFGREAVPKQA